MSNKQFEVMYNGHPVAVTPLQNDVYHVQVTYKPTTIQLKNEDGKETWVDMETGQETNLSLELGKLISKRLYTV